MTKFGTTAIKGPFLTTMPKKWNGGSCIYYKCTLVLHVLQWSYPVGKIKQSVGVYFWQHSTVFWGPN